MFQTVIAFFDAEFFRHILGLLLTALTTFFVTRFSLMAPHRIEIKKKQFKQLYLPLYKITVVDNPSAFSVSSINSDAERIAEETSRLLSENYELAFPTLHVLKDVFCYDVKAKQNCYESYTAMVYQINLDYENLKRALGYPSETRWESFKRMNPVDKSKFIKEIIVGICIALSPAIIYTIIAAPSETLPFVVATVITIILSYGFDLAAKIYFKRKIKKQQTRKK